MYITINENEYMYIIQQASVQECSPDQSSTNTFTTATPNYNYPILDSSTLLILQQGRQMPNVLSHQVYIIYSINTCTFVYVFVDELKIVFIIRMQQGNGQVLWDADMLGRQRNIGVSSAGFTTNNLASFH